MSQTTLYQHVCDIPKLGNVLVTTSDHGVASIMFPDREHDDALQTWRAHGWTITAKRTALHQQFAREAAAFAKGTARTFHIAHDHRYLPPFIQQVLTALREVAAGTTVTYGQLANRCGNPRAARAVGMAMRRNPTPILVPCHRVVASTGLGGFTPGLDVKRELLRLEGTPFTE